VQSGKILVAEHDGVHAIKLVGDVRVTLCGEFYEYIQSLLADEGLVDCLIDLSETDNLDSTTLGLLAKIASNAAKMGLLKPTVCGPGDSIYNLLASMSFDKVFKICRDQDAKLQCLQELKEQPCSDGEMRDRVIEAHKILMAMSDSKKATFRPLVEALEAEQRVAG